MAEDKDRRANRLAKRNAKIVTRFIYFFEDKRMRYDDVLKKLEWEEFFLSQSTLEQVIMERGYYKKTRKPGMGAVKVSGNQIELFTKEDKDDKRGSGVEVEK